MLVSKNPRVWPNLEAARKSILYRRGRLGKRNLATRRSALGVLPSTAPSRPWNPEGYLPKSDEKPFLPFKVTVTKRARILVLSDIHIPYHNLPALEAALKEGQRQKCDHVLLNGDTLDFYALSRFSKDPRARNAKSEIALANQLLDAIDELFPKARKIFKFGNHDERYAHYLQAHATELFAVLAEHASLEKLLELEDRGWEWVTDKRPIHLGKLPVIHGHEYPTPVLGPVNAARGLFLRTKECAMTAHHHQSSEHTETTIKGQMITAWSTGCLCGLHPEYARFNKWNHGAATVDLFPDGSYRVHNFRIHSGQIMN
jgi:predicted phosphodiesterase